MMTVSLIAAALAAAQYQYPSAPPPRQPQAPAAARSFDAAPFVQVYRKCFDEASNEAKTATAEVKQQKFDACRSMHEPIVEHVTAKLDASEAESVRRALHHAFADLEKRYAKQMGVALPTAQ